MIVIAAAAGSAVALSYIIPIVASVCIVAVGTLGNYLWHRDQKAKSKNEDESSSKVKAERDKERHRRDAAVEGVLTATSIHIRESGKGTTAQRQRISAVTEVLADEALATEAANRQLADITRTLTKLSESADAKGLRFISQLQSQVTELAKTLPELHASQEKLQHMLVALAKVVGKHDASQAALAKDTEAEQTTLKALSAHLEKSASRLSILETHLAEDLSTDRAKLNELSQQILALQKQNKEYMSKLSAAARSIIILREENAALRKSAASASPQAERKSVTHLPHTLEHTHPKFRGGTHSSRVTADTQTASKSPVFG